MTTGLLRQGAPVNSSSRREDEDRRYCAWFLDLDAWTEYWDIYHPETRGRFYFGDGAGEPGLLRQFVPREGEPPAFLAWTRRALSSDASDATFRSAVRVPAVAAAVLEVDSLIGRLFAVHFGDAGDPRVRADYLNAIFRFATNALPPARERDARIAETDPRKSTAGRHTLEGDLMWFAWALHLEAAQTIAGRDGGHARRALLLAGVATGCPANFAWRGHRRTRAEYHADAQTVQLLQDRGMAWANDFDAAAREIYALYRIREWGHAD